MIQDVVLRVDTSNPITGGNESQVILYDNQRKVHYAMSRETLLAVQNNKIKELEERLNAKTEELIRKERLFEEELTRQHNEFLKIYKDSNAKMIEMIKQITLSTQSKEKE